MITVLTVNEYSDVLDIPDECQTEGAWKARPDSKTAGNENDNEVAARLGLHSEKNPKAGDYVGLVWWPKQKGKTALCVTPKFQNMDYLAMYLECLQHPDVAGHMDKCFFFWPEDPLIEITRSQIPLDEAAAPFAAMAFVRELHDMVKRNMRRNFIRQEENLTGRMKGRLLMGRHVQKNLLTGRPDRNYCQYGVISEDCRENQILLAALDRCSRKLLQHETVKKDANILRMIRVCRAALQGVTLRRHIHNRDFSGIRYTGTFIHYKRPHALAKIILNSTELDPSVAQSSNGDDLVKVVSFALCTSELFERYCEVKLRENGKLNIWDGDENLGTGSFRYRPDFLCVEQKANEVIYWILDSKYCRSYQNSRDMSEANVQQLLKYSQHKAVRKKLFSLEENGTETPLSLAVLYPAFENPSVSFDLIYSKDYDDFIFRLGFIPVYVPKIINESMGSDSIDLT